MADFRESNYHRIPFRDGFLFVDHDRFTRYAETPTYMVQCGPTTSTVSGFEDHAPLIHYQYFMQREYEQSASGELGAAGATRLSETVIVLPHSSYGPDIGTNLINGTPIETIEIVRLTTAGEPNAVASKATFGNCFVTYLSPYLELLVIGYRATTYDWEVTGFGQDAAQAGNAVLSYDMTIAASGG